MMLQPSAASTSAPNNPRISATRPPAKVRSGTPRTRLSTKARVTQANGIPVTNSDNERDGSDAYSITQENHSEKSTASPVRWHESDSSMQVVRSSEFGQRNPNSTKVLNSIGQATAAITPLNLKINSGGELKHPKRASATLPDRIELEKEARSSCVSSLMIHSARTFQEEGVSQLWNEVAQTARCLQNEAEHRRKASKAVFDDFLKAAQGFAAKPTSMSGQQSKYSHIRSKVFSHRQEEGLLGSGDSKELKELLDQSDRSVPVQRKRQNSYSRATAHHARKAIIQTGSKRDLLAEPDTPSSGQDMEGKFNKYMVPAGLEKGSDIARLADKRRWPGLPKKTRKFLIKTAINKAQSRGEFGHYVKKLPIYSDTGDALEESRSAESQANSVESDDDKKHAEIGNAKELEVFNYSDIFKGKDLGYSHSSVGDYGKLSADELSCALAIKKPRPPRPVTSSNARPRDKMSHAFSVGVSPARRKALSSNNSSRKSSNQSRLRVSQEDSQKSSQFESVSEKDLEEFKQAVSGNSLMNQSRRKALHFDTEVPHQLERQTVDTKSSSSVTDHSISFAKVSSPFVRRRLVVSLFDDGNEAAKFLDDSNDFFVSRRTVKLIEKKNMIHSTESNRQKNRDNHDNVKISEFSSEGEHGDNRVEEEEEEEAETDGIFNLTQTPEFITTTADVSLTKTQGAQDSIDPTKPKQVHVSKQELDFIHQSSDAAYDAPTEMMVDSLALQGRGDIALAALQLVNRIMPKIQNHADVYRSLMKDKKTAKFFDKQGNLKSIQNSDLADLSTSSLDSLQLALSFEIRRIEAVIHKLGIELSDHRSAAWARKFTTSNKAIQRDMQTYNKLAIRNFTPERRQVDAIRRGLEREKRMSKAASASLQHQLNSLASSLKWVLKSYKNSATSRIGPDSEHILRMQSEIEAAADMQTRRHEEEKAAGLAPDKSSVPPVVFNPISRNEFLEFKQQQANLERLKQRQQKWLPIVALVMTYRKFAAVYVSRTILDQRNFAAKKIQRKFRSILNKDKESRIAKVKFNLRWVLAWLIMKRTIKKKKTAVERLIPFLKETKKFAFMVRVRTRFSRLLGRMQRFCNGFLSMHRWRLSILAAHFEKIEEEFIKIEMSTMLRMLESAGTSHAQASSTLGALTKLVPRVNPIFRREVLRLVLRDLRLNYLDEFDQFKRKISHYRGQVQRNQIYFQTMRTFTRDMSGEHKDRFRNKLGGMANLDVNVPSMHSFDSTVSNALMKRIVAWTRFQFMAWEEQRNMDFELSAANFADKDAPNALSANAWYAYHIKQRLIRPWFAKHPLLHGRLNSMENLEGLIEVLVPREPNIPWVGPQAFRAPAVKALLRNLRELLAQGATASADRARQIQAKSSRSFKKLKARDQAAILERMETGVPGVVIHVKQIEGEGDTNKNTSKQNRPLGLSVVASGHDVTVCLLTGFAGPELPSDRKQRLLRGGK